MNINTINDTFKSIANYRMIIEEAKSELEQLERIIKDYMQKENIETLLGNEHKATYKNVTSTRFDSKAFKLDSPAVYERYTITSDSMRFTFK